MGSLVRADARARADRAWHARVMGATWEQAAEIAGFANKSNAMRSVRKHYGGLPEPETTELRNLWRARLDWLYTRNAGDVADGKPGAVVAGVRLAEAAMKLDGLAAPAQVEIGVTPSQREMEDFIRSVVALTRGRDLPDEADIFGCIEDAEVIEETA